MKIDNDRDEDRDNDWIHMLWFSLSLRRVSQVTWTRLIGTKIGSDEDRDEDQDEEGE